MKRQLRFEIPGSPQSKARHRTVPRLQCLACRKMVNGQWQVCPECGGQLRFLANIAYSDSKTERFENLVAMCARSAMNGEGFFVNPVRVTMYFYFDMPISRKCMKDHTLSERTGCKKLHANDYHSQRPDADNLCKAIYDGCNKVVWADDAIASVVIGTKLWSDQPRTEVLVEEL